MGRLPTLLCIPKEGDPRLGSQKLQLGLRDFSPALNFPFRRVPAPGFASQFIPGDTMLWVLAPGTAMENPLFSITIQKIQDGACLPLCGEE